MKTKLNTHLLSTLPRVMRMTNNEVSDASGISIACWYRLLKAPEKITVQQLLGLANGLLVPVSRFFSPGRGDITDRREDYVMKTGYQNCYYDSDAVRRRIGEGTATSWREAADAVGMHWTNVSASLLAVSRTPVTRLLALCETFGFDPFDFLVDPNRDPGRRHGTAADGRRFDELTEEVAGLRRDVKALAETVAGLTKKYEDLLEAHRILLDRFNEHVEDGFGGVAAEDLPPRRPDR